MQGKTMTEGSPWKHIFRFAMPIMAGALLQQLYNTVDTIIVGRFAGENALSAVGTTGSFLFLFMAIALGFSSGNSIVVAQHFGAGDKKRMRTTASTGIILLLVMGLILTGLAFLVARPALTHLVAVPDSIMHLTLQYFLIFSSGLIFQFAYNIFAGLLRAVGDSASTLYFLLISSVANVVLDLLFVGVFSWSVAGAAVATVISQALSALTAYVYMIRKYPVFRFRRKEWIWRSQDASRSIKVGFPIALQLMIVSLGLTFIQRVVNGFGVMMTASFTVGQRIEMYMNLPCNAFQTTLATYTGQNIGAGKMDRVRVGARQTILLSLGFTLIVSAIVFLFSDPIIDLFSLSGQARDYCNAHLHAIALINIVLSIYVPLFGLFQGANHSAVPTFVAAGALTTRVFVTYLFRYSSLFGASIVWWNGLFGFGIGALITWLYYLSGRWKTIGL